MARNNTRWRLKDGGWVNRLSYEDFAYTIQLKLKKRKHQTKVIFKISPHTRPTSFSLGRFIVKTPQKLQIIVWRKSWKWVERGFNKWVQCRLHSNSTKLKLLVKRFCTSFFNSRTCNLSSTKKQLYKPELKCNTLMIAREQWESKIVLRTLSQSITSMQHSPHTHLALCIINQNRML